MTIMLSIFREYCYIQIDLGKNSKNEGKRTAGLNSDHINWPVKKSINVPFVMSPYQEDIQDKNTYQYIYSALESREEDLKI